MSTGLHTDTHPLSRRHQSTVELLRPLAVHEPLLLQFSSFCIHESYLLKARMVIAPYNEHVGSFLRACWLAYHHQLYSSTGADIVMESITFRTQKSWHFALFVPIAAVVAVNSFLRLDAKMYDCNLVGQDVVLI